MPCEEWNRLFKEYEAAIAKITPYPQSSNGVPQSFQDVLAAEQLQKTLHQKSAALAEHDKAHGCAVTQTKK